MDHAHALAAAKHAVLGYQAALDAAPDSAAPDVLSRHLAPNAVVHATYPFADDLTPEAAAKTIWAPIRRAFAPLQRRQDIFFAGLNDLNGGATTWVVSMGHLLGLFDAPFCGVRPNRQATMLRYCEFCQVAGDQITDVTLFLDVMNFMALAGAEAMVPSTAATMVTPGPRTQDGLLFDAVPPDEGQQTLRLFQRMINRLLDANVETARTDLSLDWTQDMIWWGPGGIGAPYTQERYLAQHGVPFSEGLQWGEFFGHRCEIAEGHYGGFFGWPTFDVLSRGGYIGLAPKSDHRATMRVVDLYRREGDKIAENWNFIDHLHFLDQLGVDLIARQRALTGL
ncbi:MAG: nuclear transport factor 2 family protein [Pseudomonadota bacterium]